MKKLLPLQKLLRWTTAAVMVGFTGHAFTHGDVTPHPVDTAGLPSLGTESLSENPWRGNAAAIAVGELGYSHNCAGCHGLQAVAGGMAPDVRDAETDCLSKPNDQMKSECLKETDVYFKNITLRGKRNGEGRYVMPAYEGVFTQEAIWAVKSYIDARAVQNLGK